MMHLVAAAIAAPFAFSGWVTFMAEPLIIDETKFVKSVYKPGDEFVVVSKGHKAAWAARACVAKRSSIYLRDSTGLVAEFKTPRNYNDGTIYAVVTQKKMPITFSEGEGEGWDSVTYRCFGFYDINAYSKQRGKFRVVGQ
jgi:hypothetical protein